jgi:cyanophycinase
MGFGEGHGPVALLGSGEFLPVMEDLDRLLLEGRPRRVIHLPTAAALEGPARVGHWAQMAEAHFARIGAVVETLPVHTAADAHDPALAARVEGAGMLYMSGGKPSHLVGVLRGSPLWDAMRDAWAQGAAMVGCSAGAMAMSATLPAFRSKGGPALGMLDHITVVPHYDRFGRLMRPVTRVDGRSLIVVGIDENTAAHGGPRRWSVHGHGRVHVIGNGRREAHSAGSVFQL